MLRGLAAAGVIVLLVGGGVILANQRSASSGHSGAAAPPSRRVTNPAVGIAPIGSVAATRLRYRHGAEYVYTDAVVSGRNYNKADLAAGVRSEVANSPNVAYPQATMVPSSAAQPEHRLKHTTVGQLESCLSMVAASVPGPVVLVEIARYLRRPATIIVFKAGSGAFDVIVVGEACGLAGQDIITRLVVPTK